MLFIRSLIFNILFWLLIFILGILGLPFSLIYRPFVFKVAKAWSFASLWLLRVICNITYQVNGKENIPTGRSLIAAKHQSAWDTIIFWALLENPSFVLKRELIYFPVFGWYLILLKNIYIDRKSGINAIKKMIKEAKEIIASGRAIVVFPEGTRTLPNASSVYQPG
ncbi:MAG: lysophospholipid acyltransferase family protein, partial [Pseudomonadota bacterium]